MVLIPPPYATLQKQISTTRFIGWQTYTSVCRSLQRAEGSPNVNAINYVNAIRQRANLAPLGALSQTAFEQEVWLQRYFELCSRTRWWFRYDPYT